MSFRVHRALAVTWKEALDLRKNPGLLASMLALPAVLVLVPTGVVWAWLRHPDTVTFRVRRSTVSGPCLSTSVPPPRRCPRRSTARILASSSARPNGLTR